MAVTSVNSTQAWRLALIGEASVDTNSGEIRLTNANFAPGSDTPLDGLTVAEGPVDLSGASSLTIPAGSPLNTYPLQVFINTIISATARVGYVAVPLGGAGTIVSATAVCDATPTVGSAVFTGAIGSTAITNGAITVATTDTLGTAKTVVPTAENVVAGGNVIKFTTSGGNTAAGTAMITLTILRSPPA